MRIVYPNIESIIHIQQDAVSEIIIENQLLFSEIISDIAHQIEGEDGKAILSIKDSPVEWHKYADLTIQPIPFDVNRKSLLNKVTQALEKECVEEDNYTVTAGLLSEIELFLDNLSLKMPCELNYTKLSMGSILHAAGIEINCVGLSDIEKIYLYMELVREFEREKVFFFVNLRSFFNDEKMNLFIETVLNHDLKVVLLESTARDRLNKTKRIVIDEDLCEF